MLKVPSREDAVSENPTPSTETLEQLQQELSDRQSIVHFAHAAISGVVAVILGMASGKLFWDSIRLSYVGVLAAVVALAALVYACVHYRKARRLLAEEHRRFEVMKQMREALHLDDPSALLPQ